MSAPKSAPKAAAKSPSKKVPFYKYGVYVSMWLMFIFLFFGEMKPSYFGLPEWAVGFLGSGFAALVFMSIWALALRSRHLALSKEEAANSSEDSKETPSQSATA